MRFRSRRHRWRRDGLILVSSKMFSVKRVVGRKKRRVKKVMPPFLLFRLFRLLLFREGCNCKDFGVLGNIGFSNNGVFFFMSFEK